MQVVLCSMLLLAGITAPRYGQGLQAGKADAMLPAYDVMSIKPNTSGSGNVGVDSGLNTLQAVNVSLANLLESAYGIKKELISGVPKPLDTARFDVSAKIVEPDMAALKQLTPVQYRAMLKPLLTERFHLKVHMAIKQLPVYDLVVIKGGAKFKESPAGYQGGSGMHANNRELTAIHIPIASLADFLVNRVHRTVIDRTELTGKYDLVLKWSPENDPDTAGDAAPPMFTALQEQLGLKLLPAKGPVETLAVDHAELPTPD